MEKITQLFNEKKSIISWRRVWVSVILVFALAGIVWTGLVAYAKGYEGKVIHGVTIGEMPIGGMNAAELKLFLQDMNDKLVNEGLHVILEEKSITHDLVIYPLLVTDTNSVELIIIDVDAEVERYLLHGKQGGIIDRSLNIIKSRIGGESVPLIHVTANNERIIEAVSNYVAPFENPARDATVNITSVDPLEFSVVTSSIGTTYVYEDITEFFVNKWKTLEVPYISLQKVESNPQVTNADIEPLLEDIQPILSGDSITLNFTDPQTSRESRWSFNLKDMAKHMRVIKTADGFEWQLSVTSTSKYLMDVIANDITVEAQDAKFKVESGKVVEFQGSRPGITVDVEQTFNSLNEAFRSRYLHNEPTKSVQVITKQTEPNLSTGEVNDLGIKEILGQGESVYAGSPSNRIKNIRNAVLKLNGVLIKPGEEFSTIEYTKPYTLEGGYLPELVIKGDELIPEIGGGLCQIGSTLFRMAMNSGLEITERRNHSLVVSYYNDLSNGLPGTDATLYDPAPDFKFRNDTEDYILIAAEMDEINQRLIFTIWGTNDGRSAGYSPPEVTRWIPHGNTRIVETTKLAPGVRECQSAFRGANARFTYSRTMPDGRVEDRVFESHYRPLPQICLVGVAINTPSCAEGDESCMPKSSTEENITEQAPAAEQEPVVEEIG